MPEWLSAYDALFIVAFPLVLYGCGRLALWIIQGPEDVTRLDALRGLIANGQPKQSQRQPYRGLPLDKSNAAASHQRRDPLRPTGSLGG